MRTAKGWRLASLIVVLLALLPWAPQAHAGDTRIDFNDLPDSTTVSTQYQTLGVVFQDSFPAGGGSTLPTIRKTAFAASVPNILDIRAPGGGEFRPNAVVGRFAGPRNHVRVVAGDWAADLGHTDTATVTLAAYTLGGHVIEQQTAMVRSGEAFHVALSVSAASNSIYFFSISAGFDHYVGIDDLSFDPAGGSPAGFALTRDRPADEPVVVRPGAVGVGTNIVIRRSSSSSGPINLSVTGLPAGVGVGFAANPTSGGDGATDQLTLTAAPGTPGATATLTVSGVGGPAAGSGTPVSIPLIVAGYGYDAEVTGVEVTQGVQDLRLPERGAVATAPAPYTGVKLMARGKTIVRVYADLRRGYPSSIASLDGVDIDLYGYRPGSSTPLAGSPLHPSLGQRTLKLAAPRKPGEGAVSDAERAKPSGAFTFVLPPDWTTGTISLKATIYPPADLLPSLLECPGVACQDNNSFTLSTIRFTPTGYLEIAPVALSVKGGDTLSVPSAVCYKTITHHDGIEEVSGAYACTSSGVFAGVRNITPSDVGVPTGYAGAIDVSDIAGNTSLDDTMRGAAAAARLWDFANDRPEWFRNDEFDVHSDALVVGVFPQGAVIRSTTHYDNAGNILDDDEFPVAVVPDGGRPLTAVAHEIYHMLGRQHADHSCGGDAEAAGGSEAWTDPRGYTGGIGLDRRDNSGGLGQYAILAPNNGGRPNATGTYTGSQFYDFMSYCTGGSDSVAWTSPTGWNRVVDQFATGPAGAMTSGSVSAAAARTTSAIALHPATLVAASAVRQTIRVLVIPDGNGGVGLLQLTPGASIEALSVSPPRLGAYTLVARDTAGHALLTTALVAGGGHSEPGSRSFFHAEIPARGVAGITIVHNGRTLITRDRNPNPPKLVVLDPRGGQTIGGQGSVTVRWRATTADTHPLLARVDYSADDGHTWRPLYLGPNPNHATLPARFLSAAHAARIRVVVEDGFNQTMAVSGRFTALGAPPMVAILSPGDGNQIVANASLYLSGEGFDDANRPLPGGRLGWYDGKRVLGGGLQISVSGLAPGKHTISLVGRDAQGRVGEASVSVLVLPVQTIRRLAPGQALPPLTHGPTASPVATVTPTTLPNRGLPPSATPTTTMILAAPTTTPTTGTPASSATSTSSPTASPTGTATQPPTATETPVPVATATATATATKTTVPAPSVGFSPQSMDFGQVNVAGNGASRDISLINDGPGPLSVSDAAIVPGPNTPAGVFTLTGNTCINGPVVPNGSCTLTVLFVPRITGQVDATLSVTDTGVGSPQGVPLTGYGYHIQ